MISSNVPLLTLVTTANTLNVAGGARLSNKGIGIAILTILLCVGWGVWWMRKNIDDNWNGWFCGIMATLPIIIFAIILLFI